MGLKLPCGRCIGCRLERSRQWATRCMHEASCHDENSFLTLTYSDSHLPTGGTLDKNALSLFIKRTRKMYPSRKLSYFGCGEYGEKLGRPHYHVLLFGLDFPDKYTSHETEQGHLVHTSPTLDKLWPFGQHLIGKVSFESAAYVARYCTKKIGGELAEEHYKRVDTLTGEIHDIEPEFMRCSLKPAIGKRWFEKYGQDINKGFLTHKGQKIPTPKYYEKLLAESDEYRSVMLKSERALARDSLDPDFTLDRLRVKEDCKIYQIQTLKRKLK